MDRYRCGLPVLVAWRQKPGQAGRGAPGPAATRRGKTRERLRRQPLLGRDPAEQGEQLTALLTGQAGRDLAS